MPKVCLIVPCYNEEQRFDVAGFRSFLSGDADRSLCLVNDGSRDNTARVLEDIRTQAATRVHIVTLESNRGKGEAVRRGVLHALSVIRPDFVGYWDADGATPQEEVCGMVAIMVEHPDCHMVLGSRWKRLGSEIERRAIRHVLGRVFATLTSVTLSLPVYDSQCGAKLVRADTAAVLFGDPFVSKWLFDVELLARLGAAGPTRSASAGVAAIEMPLNSWRDVRGSRFRWSQMAIAPLDLIRIRLRYSQNRGPY
jgi:glycosyltransferase involved in cell wall biosynthesis